MFQMTSREPIEPMNEEAGDLVDLGDVSGSKHTQETTDHTDEVNGDNPNQRVSREELGLPVWFTVGLNAYVEVVKFEPYDLISLT